MKKWKMKRRLVKDIITLLVASIGLVPTLADDSGASIGVDLGYGYNYSWGTDPCIQQSNGIVIGLKANTHHFLWGFDVYCDIDGKYPAPNEANHHLVDYSGAVRLGYEIKHFGFGVLLGGYQKALYWVGYRKDYVVTPGGYYPYPYYPYYPEPYPRVRERYYSIYCYERGFLYGGFLTYTFLKDRSCSPYIMVEMNNIQPFEVTIGIEFNFM